jgi:hypothetical protein
MPHPLLLPLLTIHKIDLHNLFRSEKMRRRVRSNDKVTQLELLRRGGRFAGIKKICFVRGRLING